MIYLFIFIKIIGAAVTTPLPTPLRGAYMFLKHFLFVFFCCECSSCAFYFSKFVHVIHVVNWSNQYLYQLLIYYILVPNTTLQNYSIQVETVKTEQREEDVLVLIPVADFVLFVQNFKMVSVECNSFPQSFSPNVRIQKKNDMF